MSDYDPWRERIMKMEAIAAQRERYLKAILATEGKSPDEMPLEWAEVWDAIKEMQEPL